MKYGFYVLFLSSKTQTPKTIRVRFTSPGDDLDSFEPPKKYVIKIGHHVNSTHFEESCCEVVEDDLFGSSTLDPVNGGSVKDIYIRYLKMEPKLLRRLRKYDSLYLTYYTYLHLTFTCIIGTFQEG